jgi:cell wall-associated NlpC family hydrolase
MRYLNSCLIIALSISFFGCQKERSQVQPYTKAPIKDYKDASEYNQAINFPPQKQIETLDIKTSLLLHYQDWKNTKYKYGGTTKRGIDCSAFVQKTFKSRFNIKIPRTTLLQVKKGEKISRKDLQAGDLVFFKTGRNQRHVGIYLSKGNFMHASTKRGVTISNLNNPYYSSHFWTAKRIDFNF